jgi:hypothetical protein
MAGKAQYWVVNNSPPGTGPGGAAYTSYAIVRGTFDQASNIPNAGGVSGPYPTLAEAYKVYRAEPQNKDVSGLTQIGQYLGTGLGFAIYGPGSPGQVVGAGKTGGQAANAVADWTQGIAHWLGEAVAHILDIHMWRSIGWITLGLVLMVLGLLLWLKKENYLPSAVPVPV